MDVNRIIRDFCAAWGRGDIEAIVDAFSDDAVYHNIPMPPCDGKDAIREFVPSQTTGTFWPRKFRVRSPALDEERYS